VIIRIAKYERYCNHKGESENRDEYEVIIDGFTFYKGLEVCEADAVSKAFKNKQTKELK